MTLAFPHGFLDFLRKGDRRRHRVGDHELEPAGLERFNRALRELSPQAPAITMDQIAGAATTNKSPIMIPDYKLVQCFS
jgi:hypothetical protein